MFLLRVTLRSVPMRMASRMGDALGWFLFAVVRLKRRQTLANLELAFGEKLTPAERLAMARRCYRHIGSVIGEFLNHPRLVERRMEDFIVLENPEVLEEALAPGKGAVLTLGHQGNWEIVGAGIVHHGLQVTAYVGEQHNPAADALINGIRQSIGMGTVPKRSAARGMIRTLREGKILAILPDQHYSRNRHFVRYFGRVVSVAPGVATMVRHAGVPVIFSDTWRVGRFRYRTRFHCLDLPPHSGNDEYEILVISQAFMSALETAVRRHPEQYFWMHRRWRHPPEALHLSPVNQAFLDGKPPPVDAPRNDPPEEPA